jgi:collagen beta-1,O-galactosyltransferase
VVNIIDKIYVVWHLDDLRKELEDKLVECFPNTEVTYIEPCPNSRDPEFPQWLKDNDYLHCEGWKQGNAPNPKEWFPKEGTGWHRRDMKYGEIACSIGHLSAWKQAKKDNVKNALFLEQDAMIDKGHEISIKSYMDRMDIDYDFLYAGFCASSLEGSHINSWLVKPKFVFCLHSYIVTDKGIDILLNNDFEHNLCPVDEYVPALFAEKGNEKINPVIRHLHSQLKAYVIFPRLINQLPKNISGSGTEDSEYVPKVLNSEVV